MTSYQLNAKRSRFFKQWPSLQYSIASKYLQEKYLSILEWNLVYTILIVLATKFIHVTLIMFLHYERIYRVYPKVSPHNFPVYKRVWLWKLKTAGHVLCWLVELKRLRISAWSYAVCLYTCIHSAVLGAGKRPYGRHSEEYWRKSQRVTASTHHSFLQQRPASIL